MHFLALIFSTAFALTSAPAPHVFYYETITFKKGSREISADEIESFRALLKTIRDKKQKIEEVHVVVWPDKLNEKSSAKVRDLVDARISVIEDTLEDRFGIGNVESYDMSRRSNWFSRGLSLSEKELKALFAQRGAPANVAPEDFQIVKTKGGPGRAILLIELEGTQP